jgi:CoA:oxalate CoA-transferase
VAPLGRERLRCLDGYVVLDLTDYLAGPYATDILAGLGATVIKVEPPAGSFTRNSHPPWVTAAGPSREPPPAGVEGNAVQFHAVNSGKLSTTLDLTTAEGQRVLRRLVLSADAFLHNFRPSSAERLGVRAEDLMPVNPRLVYCSIGGLGPYAEPGDDRPVLDPAVQALAGTMVRDGNGAPRPIGIPVGDLAAGLYAAIAVMGGLLGRDGRRSKGEGGSYSVSMLASLNNLLWDKPLDARVRWNLDVHQHHVVLTAFECADGDWLFVAAPQQDQWERLVRATAIPELASPQYLDIWARRAAKDVIYGLITEWARTLPRHEALGRLEAEGVAAWPVRTMSDIVEDERFNEHCLYEIEDPLVGATGLHGAAFPIVADELRDRGPAGAVPLFAEHTEEVLRRYAGLTEDEVRQLADQGVTIVRSHGPD